MSITRIKFPRSLHLMGGLAFLFTCVSLTSDAIADEPVHDELVASMADTLWSGVQQSLPDEKQDASEVPLIGLIKVLRQSGIDSAAAAGGRGGGAGGRSGGGRAQRGGGGGMPSTTDEVRAKFDSMDLDRDGVWKGDEINSYMRGQPASSDNEVTFEEYNEAWNQLRSRMGSGGGHQHGGGQGGNRGGRGGGGERGSGERGGHNHGGGRGGHGGAPSSSRVNTNAEFVVALDVNRDRKLTRAELQTAIATALNPKPAGSGAGDETTPAPPANRGLQRRTEMQVRAIAVCSAWHAIDQNGDEKIQLSELKARVGSDASESLAEAMGITQEKPLPMDQLYASARRLSDELTAAALQK